MRHNVSTLCKTGQIVGLAAALLFAVGCGKAGPDGAAGPDGPAGQNGPEGDQGTQGPQGQIPPELPTWDKLLAGIGGQAALDGLTGYTIEASGVRKMTGEGPSLGAPSFDTDHFDVTTHVDLMGDAMRVDWSRSILFLNGLPLTYSEIINADLGYVEGDDHAFGPAVSTTDMPSARWAAVRKQNMLLNPHGLLAMVSADPSLVSDGGPVLLNGALHDSLVIQDDTHPITAVVSRNTGRLVALRTMENDHLYRDVPLEVFFGDWEMTANGLAFPMTVMLTVNGQIFHEEYRTTVTPNPAFTNEFDFPGGANPMYDADSAMWGRNSHQFLQAFNGLGIPQNVEQLAVVATELEPYVHFLGGSTHNSMAIEQETGVVIVEPPLYPERSEAILAWVAANIGKPVTHIVITHHHVDHSAGFRAFVAAGATVVAGGSSAGELAAIAARPSTIVPDTQATAQQAARVTAVHFGSAAFMSTVPPFPTVVGAALTTSHADDMIFALIQPAGGMTFYIFQSDLFTPDPAGPGSALNPQSAQELLDSINLYGLNMPGTTLVGGHGLYAPISQLEDYVNPPPP